MSLTEQEIRRYSRHIILPEVGGRGQRKLKEASVLVVGLGGPGCAAALYLAAAGVGRIGLWDPERVTASDLESGIAHDCSRLGLPRARSAMVALKAINPDAQVECLDIPVSDCDVAVVSADREVQARLGVVLCTARGAAGAVTALRAGEWHQGFCSGPEERAVAAAAGVIGSAAATEAIKILLGIGDPLFGRIFRYDGWGAVFEG